MAADPNTLKAPLASFVAVSGYDRGLTVLPTDKPLTMPCSHDAFSPHYAEPCDDSGRLPLAGPVQLIEPCPDCGGGGNVMHKGYIVSCQTCDGFKRVVVAHATAEQVPERRVGRLVQVEGGWVATRDTSPGGWAVLLTDIVWTEPSAWMGPTEPGWHQ